jgi:cephalosporin-C deacetylase-like acetyl esterase
MAFNRRQFLFCSAASVAAGRLLAQQATLPHGSPGVTLYARPRDYSNDLPRYLARLMEEGRAERRRILAGITTREKLLERQKYIRDKMWELLGGPFEKTPLNPRVTGSVPRQGYRIDRLVYESRPGLFVTSNLYVPEGRGPFPAILGSMGHSANGKAHRPYQTLFHTLARKGYMVLAFDPFGQGERIEYPGAVPGTSTLGGPTREHDYAGKRLLLLGVNFALYRAWDGVRGIDYLLSRSDVDPERIGCGGQSGGGTMTMYLAALDQRIRAAVVSEGNTENVAQADFEPPGAVDDAEQNLVPSLVHGIDRFDFLHAVAPRALLITITNKDAGSTYGPDYVNDGMALIEELKKTYALLNAAGRVALVETPMRHAYSYEHRRASYGWYNRWLGGNVPGRDDSEPPVTVEEDKALWCTPNGSVAALNGESSFTLTRKLAAKTRPAAPPTEETIRRVLGLLPVDRAAEASMPVPHQLLSTTEKHDHAIDELDITSEREIHVPVWVVRPLKAAEKLPAVLMLSDSGKEGFVAEGGMAADFAAAGAVFSSADLRGRGQCAPRPPSRGPNYYSGRGEDFYIWDTLMLGRPMLGGYVHDALQALRCLRHRPQVDPARLWVIGQGTMGVVALLALALDPALRGAFLQSALSEYRSIVENDRYTTPFRIYATGLLRHFDLPDVAALAAPRKLVLLNPLDQAAVRLLTKAAPAVRLAKIYPSAAIAMADPVTASTFMRWIKE